jgi:methionyl-tRNA formyltransferase
MPPVVEHVVVSGQFDVIGVGGVEPQRHGSKSAWLRAQVVYWGLWGTAWIAVATLLRKFPSLLRFPRVFRRLSSLAEVCTALEIPYEDIPDVNDPAFVSKLRDLDIDVIVSFQQAVFKKALLKIPKVTCLNVHTGILPGYRGFKPVFWMQSRREPEMGVTVHTMSETIDTGRIVVQRRWKRRAGSSVFENQMWSYRCAAQCIVEAVEKVEQSGARGAEEIPDGSPYFRAPTRAERDLALASGTRLF